MKPSTHTTLIKSSVSNFILFIITLFNSILLVPIYIKNWGTQNYGVWSTIISFVGLFIVLDTGHHNYISNKFAALFYQNKYSEANNILSNGMVLGFIVATIEVIIAILFLVFVLNENVEIIFGVILTLITWLLGGTIMGFLVKSLSNIGFYSKMANFAVFQKLIEMLILLLCISLKFSIHLTVIVYSLGIFIVNLVLWMYLKPIIPDLKFFENLNIRFGFKNFIKSLNFTLNSIGEQLNNNGIIIVFSKVFSPLLVPLFLTTRTLSNFPQMLSGIILQPLSPYLIKYHAVNNGSKIVEYIKISWLLMSIIGILPFIVINPFIEDLFTWWTRKQLVFDYPLYCFLIVGLSLNLFSKPVISYLTSTNQNKYISFNLFIKSGVVFAIISCFYLTDKLSIAQFGFALMIGELVGFLILLLFHLNKILVVLNQKIDLLSVLSIFFNSLLMSFFLYLMPILEVNKYALAVSALIVVFCVIGWQFKRLSINSQLIIINLFTNSFKHKQN